jgi:hypothetical protein
VTITISPAAKRHMLLLPVLLDLAQVVIVAVLVVIARSIWSRTEAYPTPREAPACLAGQEAAFAVSSALAPHYRRTGGGATEDPRYRQTGGGATDGDGDDDGRAMTTRVVGIADAIRRTLGEIVNKPGLKAIEAVLLMSTGMKQKDAIIQAGTSKPSIQKYKPLVEEILASGAIAAALASTAALAGPSAAGLVGGALAVAMLPPQSLTHVVGLRLYEEIVIDGHAHRIYAATVQRHDGTMRQCKTGPIPHEIAPPNETAAARLRRQKREHDRLTAALRQMDPEALASARAKDRERKRAKPARRTEVPWLLPSFEQPHFVGEHVWYFPAAGGSPTHAIIQQLLCDGSAQLTAATDGSVRFCSTLQDRLSRVGLPVPSYPGQRVEVECGPSHNADLACDLAEVAEVNLDGSVSLRFFDASVGAYGETSLRGCSVSVDSAECDWLVPRIVVMQDAAMMLADEALVKAGYISLYAIALVCGLSQDTDPWELVPRRWLPTYVNGKRRPNLLILDSTRVNRGAPCQSCLSESDVESESESSESEEGLCYLYALEKWQLSDARQSNDGYVPPKLVDAKRRERSTPPTLRDLQCRPLTRHRTPEIRGHYVQHCTMCREPSWCSELSFDHFNQQDHPPGRFGPHPYIVVSEAEDAGADMRQARELLGRLETAVGFDCYGALVQRPKIVPVGLEEWDAYIYQRTHRVPAVIHSGDPAGAWAALQEARRMGRDVSQLERAFDEERQRLLCAADANRLAVAEMQRGLSDVAKEPCDVAKEPCGIAKEPRPQFLRVAERAKRRKAMRQTHLDWRAQRHPTGAPSPMDTK